VSGSVQHCSIINVAISQLLTARQTSFAIGLSYRIASAEFIIIPPPIGSAEYCVEHVCVCVCVCLSVRERAIWLHPCCGLHPLTGVSGDSAAQMPYRLSRRGAQQLLSPSGRSGRTVLLQEGRWCGLVISAADNNIRWQKFRCRGASCLE